MKLNPGQVIAYWMSVTLAAISMPIDFEGHMICAAVSTIRLSTTKQR
jgi:hypothetical protein